MENKISGMCDGDFFFFLTVYLFGALWLVRGRLDLSCNSQNILRSVRVHSGDCVCVCVCVSVVCLCECV